MITLNTTLFVRAFSTCALLLMSMSLFAQDRQTMEDDYSHPARWNQIFKIPLFGGSPVTSYGEVRVENGTVVFDNASCGYTDKRVWRPLGHVLGNVWEARVAFTPTAGGAGNRSGATVLALTGGTQDANNEVPDVLPGLHGPIPKSNQDGIYVFFITPNISGTTDFKFRLKAKLGSYDYTSSSDITGLTLNTTYYVALKRTSATTIQVQAFTDPEYSVSVGSPVSMTIPSSISGLSVVQHGVIPQGGVERRLTATLDDLEVYESEGACIVCPAQNITPTSGYNYIMSETARKPATTDLQFNALSSGGERVVQVQYLDDLGRPLQAIDVQAAPGGGDMISYQQVDEFGRVAQVDLPYISNSSLGSYQSGAPSDQSGFYSVANFSYVQPSDLQNPFSVTQFEASPLNRIVEQGHPGSDWQPEANSAGTQSPTEHTIIQSSFPNPGSSNDEYAVILFPHDLTVGGTYSSFYAQDELMVTESVDEDGRKNLLFTDKLGFQILQRIQVDASANEWASTYSIYNSKGQLIYVLQPEGVNQFMSSNYEGAAKLSESLLNDFAFQYKYDKRGRIIEKRVPGAEKVYMVYDKLDRVVATQDGNQRDSRNEWSFTKYDPLNRPVMTGVIDLDQSYSLPTRPDLQNFLDQIPYGVYELSEVRGSSTSYAPLGAGMVTGYSDQTFPLVSNILASGAIHSITYYDDYDYNYDGTEDVSYQADNDNFPDNQVQTRTRGLVTGIYVRTLDPEPGMKEWLLTSTFYDEYGREIQTIADGHLGGSEQMDYAYTFSGEVIASRHIHLGIPGDNLTPYKKGITVWKFYTYDQRGRLLHIEQRTHDIYLQLTVEGQNQGIPSVFAETESEVIVRNEYNALGQLMQKNLHQHYEEGEYWQSVEYEYNIRGWMTKINDPNTSNNGESGDFFGMELFYNELGGFGTTPSYVGNISGIKWQNDVDNNPVEMQYSFLYDGLNRLLSANYSGNNGTSTTGAGIFDVALQYDLNGNIESLERDGYYSTTTGGGGVNFPEGGQLGQPQSGSYGLIDDLTYSYVGNRLINVTDIATNTAPDVVQFEDGTNTGNDYEYDENGNLEKDLNKDITNITYNLLNKPTVITYSNGEEIRYYYGADGTKYRQTVFDGTSIVKRTDYLGAIHYEDIDGDAGGSSPEIVFAQHEEGRYRPNGSEIIYEYTLTDHLGNTRVTFGDSDANWDADILQENHYYPFGMAMTLSSSTSAAPPNDYLYNGKELQAELGLDWYDYGARMYDASIGRWNGVDALALKHMTWSPYNFVICNPISMIDPDGRDVIWSPYLRRNLPANFISELSATSTFQDVYQPFIRDYDNVLIQYKWAGTRTLAAWTNRNRQENGFLISVNSQLFVDQVLYMDKTRLAGTLIHEGIHAKRSWQRTDAPLDYPGLLDLAARKYSTYNPLYAEDAYGQAVHEHMAIYDRQKIVEGMKEFDSNAGITHSEEWYQAMSWGPLRRTNSWQAFKATNPDDFDLYNKIIENEQATEEVRRTFAEYQKSNSEDALNAYKEALRNWDENLYNSTRR